MRPWQNCVLGLLSQCSFPDTRLSVEREGVRLQDPQPLFSIPTGQGITREVTARGFLGSTPGLFGTGKMDHPLFCFLPGTLRASSFYTVTPVLGSQPSELQRQEETFGGVGCPILPTLTPGYGQHAETEEPRQSPQVPLPVPRPSGSKASPGLSSSMRGSPCSLRMTLQERRWAVHG